MGEKTVTVTVRPGMHHGRSHHGGDVIDVTEADLRAFGDKFIIPPIDATPEAWDAARERGWGEDVMRFIEGSGKDGRILKSDVEAAGGDAP